MRPCQQGTALLTMCRKGCCLVEQESAEQLPFWYCRHSLQMTYCMPEHACPQRDLHPALSSEVCVGFKFITSCCHSSIQAESVYQEVRVCEVQSLVKKGRCLRAVCIACAGGRECPGS